MWAFFILTPNLLTSSLMICFFKKMLLSNFKLLFRLGFYDTVFVLL